MKNVLIIGVARAVKTTLGNMIKDEFNQYNIIHADSIIWGIIRGTGREEYYTKNIKARKELVHSDKFQRIILEIYKSSIKQDTTYGISDENLSTNADKWNEKNQLLKKECPKYGIEYIDTSKNRKQVLNQILARIDERVEIKESEECER